MRINKKLFFSATIILLCVLALVMVNLEAVQGAVDAAYNFCINQFGWLFVLTNILCLVFSLWIMFGPYKDIRLGGETAKPTYSTAAWAGMMFTTSCGAWLIVYGFLEPIYCASQDAFLVGESTARAYEYGQMYAHFHWGPNAWCIYVPISVAIGYVLYNRHAARGTISEAIKPAMHSKLGNPVGFIVDIFSVCGAAIAPVISIGTGMPLLVALVEGIFGISDDYRTTIQIVILVVWVCIFGTSVYLGLNKGIKRLSNINIAVAFGLMVFFGLIVGIFKVLASEINTVGLFANSYLRLTTYTDPYGTGSFVRGWSMSYWACYFVYMPLMGVFNAKISKGRRLKEIAFGQLVLCTLGCWVAMATFGNYAINLQQSGQLDISGYLATGDEAGAIMAILQLTPGSKIMMVVLLVVAFIFLATTMDSSAFAAAEMTTIVDDGSEQLAPRWNRVFWACMASLVAFVLLQVGGVKAVRSLCYITGLPLAIITYLVFASVIKMMREDHGEECENKKRIRIFKKE
jgi:BCCT family betaine/carnitine transporter